MIENTERLYEEAIAAKLAKQRLAPSPAREKIVLNIPVLNKKGERVGYRDYLLDKEKLLGKGSFSEVYQVFPIDKKTGDINYNSPMAVKICKEEDFDEKEAEIFKRYYRAEAPMYNGGKVYFIMQFFPGSDLFNKDQELNPEFRNLNLATTLNLINSLCISIHLLHTNTHSTGSALSHGDIKGSNIRVHIDKNNAINVYPLDFGLTDQLGDDPDRIIKTGCKGTVLYMSPESYSQKRGIKSDIYALVPIFLTLLGVEKPFIFKDALPDDDIAGTTKAKYNFENLLVKFEPELNQIGYPLKKLVTLFLNRMQDNTYQYRPNSDQLLKFFSSLNLCYKIWQKIVDVTAELKKCTTYETHIRLKGDLAALNDSLQSKYCSLILVLHNLGNAETNSHLSNSNFRKRIINLYDRNELNVDSFSFLLDYLQTFDAQVTATKTSLPKLELKGVSKLILIELEKHIEQEPFKIKRLIDQKLEKYDNHQINQLNHIMKLYNDHGVILSLQDLEQLLNSSDLNALEITKNCVQAFILRTTIDIRANPSQSITFSFRANQSTDELTPAKKLLAKLEDRNSQLTNQDENILSASTLSTLLKELNIFEKLSTPCVNVPN